MLAAPGLSYYSFLTDNWSGSFANNEGTSVTPGASNAEGSWTQIIAAASVTTDLYWLRVSVVGGATSAQDKSQLMDIGVDPAGGSSFTAVISNIVMGFSNVSYAAGAPTFIFPMLIRSGSSIGVRVQGSNATAGTVIVNMTVWGDPSHPEMVPVGQFSETIGTISGSGGGSFTPGNGAFGSWASLGTTTSDLWWWQLGTQASNAAYASTQTIVELAYGDATNKHLITKQANVQSGSEIMLAGADLSLFALSAYRPVPAGSTLYVRAICSGAPGTGWNATAIGIGG
jgi:hypothetical protein